MPRMRCGGPALCTVCQKDTAICLGGQGEYDPTTFFEDTSEYANDPDRFIKQAKLYVVSSRNNQVENPEDQLTIDDLYIVWWSKTLSNWKAMISTSKPGDGLYFEVTYNGGQQEAYVDTYLKIANDSFTQEGL